MISYAVLISGTFVCQTFDSLFNSFQVVQEIQVLSSCDKPRGVDVGQKNVIILKNPCRWKFI